MTRNAAAQFRFPAGLSVDGVDPGTNVIVGGPSGRGAREVALRLAMAGGEDEGVVLLSADVGGRSLLDRAEDVTGGFDRARVGVVDCSGIEDDQQRFDEHGRTIDDPGDLLGIQMEFSVLYETLVERGLDRVRVGVFSVSSLLAHADLRAVSRFVHMLTGRVIATGDLGVFVVDEAMQDDRTVDAIERFCDGAIDVRDGTDGTFEARVRGLGVEPYGGDEAEGGHGVEAGSEHGAGDEAWRPVSTVERDQQRRRP
mgnify:CR=1 FL=1